MKTQLNRSQFPIKPKDIEKLIDAADNLRDRVIIKLMALAGLRRAETAALEYKDIDQKTRRLTVLGKGNKQRTIPIHPSLFSDLRFYIGKRYKGFLFPARRSDSKRPHLGEYQINEIVARAGCHANLINPNGLKKINPHALRHFFAWDLKRRGVRIETIRDLMGHADIKTTLQEYGNQSIDDIQEELMKVW